MTRAIREHESIALRTGRVLATRFVQTEGGDMGPYVVAPSVYRTQVSKQGFPDKPQGNPAVDWEDGIVVKVGYYFKRDSKEGTHFKPISVLMLADQDATALGVGTLHADQTTHRLEASIRFDADLTPLMVGDSPEWPAEGRFELTNGGFGGYLRKYDPKISGPSKLYYAWKGEFAPVAPDGYRLLYTYRLGYSDLKAVVESADDPAILRIASLDSDHPRRNLFYIYSDADLQSWLDGKSHKLLLQSQANFLFVTQNRGALVSSADTGDEVSIELTTGSGSGAGKLQLVGVDFNHKLGSPLECSPSTSKTFDVKQAL